MYAVCGRSIGLTSSVRRAPSAAMRSARSAADASEYAMSEPSTTSYAPAVQGGCRRVEASSLRGLGTTCQVRHVGAGVVIAGRAEQYVARTVHAGQPVGVCVGAGAVGPSAPAELRHTDVSERTAARGVLAKQPARGVDGIDTRLSLGCLSARLRSERFPSVSVTCDAAPRAARLRPVRERGSGDCTGALVNPGVRDRRLAGQGQRQARALWRRGRTDASIGGTAPSRRPSPT